jgi:dGTPase
MATWTDVLNGERFFANAERIKSIQNGTTYSDLQRDIDLVVFSSSFRRMQRKAQVYIAPNSDFVRNRLTHTLEVSAISRLLAGTILEKIEKIDSEFVKAKDEKKFSNKRGLSKRDIIDSISAACHAHDIGNPPFGHVGEFAVRSWFKEMKNRTNLPQTHPELYTILDSDEFAWDFLHFDGNPQGFRILTRLEGWRDNGGLRLTHLTLGAFVKYICGSSEYSKKFGYFNSEEIFFGNLFDEMKLFKLDMDGNKIYFRHPFSYILEASDDIAYCCSDIEDGIKMGLIPRQEGIEVLFEIATRRTRREEIEERTKPIDKSTGNYIKFLRNAASDALVDACVSAFCDEKDNERPYKQMLDGNYEGSLLSNCNLRDLSSKAASLSRRYIYGNRAKIVKEQGGYQIVRFFLEVFSSAIEDWHKNKNGVQSGRRPSDRSINLMMIMHKLYNLDEMEERVQGNQSDKALYINKITPRQNYQKLIDFVSGMTDNYAFDLASKLRGTDFGSL